MEKQLNTLVITGGSSGIGKATAELFNQRGWRIINISRSVSGLPFVHDACFDFTQRNDFLRVKPEISAAIQGISGRVALVHNACVYRKDSIQKIDEISLTEVLQANVVIPLMLNQLLLPKLKQGSSILYIGSTLSEKGVPDCASYIISKHASIAMMRATCQDLATSKLCCMCICPGLTETKMLMQHAANDFEKMQKLQEMNLLKRFINPAELAELIWFCANNQILNGSVIHANLGQVER